jgi:radical SAM superfamily enzyme YgiQ (UPF0313 family)
MSSRLVLVNPPFQARIRRIAQTSLGPPLGLAYVAAAAREAGHDVAIVDANALGYDLDQAARAALDLRPDVLGLTAVTPTVPLAGQIAAHAKAARPDLPVLLGGPHGTALPERTLAEFPALDAIVRGEAEATIAPLLARLGAGAGLVAPLTGVAFRGPDGGVIDGGVATPIADLDTLPLPARDLLPMERYRCPDSDAFTTVLAMRGCPYPCVYCAVPFTSGKRMRYRSPEAVADEMDRATRDWGVRFFSFVDDTFTTRSEWVLQFADAVEARGLHRRARWICLTRADLVDRPLLARMKAAGCVRVEMGIESGSEAGMRFLGKRLAPEAVGKAFRAARAVGLSTMGFVILNVPGEGPADVARTLALALEADPDYLQLSFLTPYPGTLLWDEARKNGWIRTEDWAEYRFLNAAVLSPDGRPEAEVTAEGARFQRAFYLRPRTVVKLGRLLLNGTSEWRPLLRTALTGLGAAFRRSEG